MATALAPETDWPASTPRLDLLTGVRVVELSARAAGAYAGRLLALLGADVRRVELPALLDCRHEEETALLAHMHEHKTPIAAEPALVAAELTRAAVVVTDCSEDHPDDEVRRFVRGALAAVTSDTAIVRLPVTSDGRPGTTLTACAASAMSWAIGDRTDAPLALPFDLPEHLLGAEGAAMAALAVLAATESGGGERWSASLEDALAAYVGQIAANFVPYHRPWHRDGARATMSGGSYPAAMFRCRDGWVSVMCRTQVEWHGLANAVGHAHWLSDERYRDARVVARLHADELDPVIASWCAARTREEVFAVGREHAFPVAPVHDMTEALGQEQLAHRRFFVRREPVAGSPPAPLAAGSPFRLREPEGAIAALAAPSPLGQGGRPLTGLRVVDLSWVWSGPMVAASLADLGADVIRVESHTRPDPSRLRGRAYRSGRPLEGPELEVTPYHNQMNRQKRSIEVDITTAEGANRVRELVRSSHVVVENLRPGVLARRGLDFASLSRERPDLVMVSLSMLGQSGPLSGIRGYAVVMTGLSGVDSLVGYSRDRLIGTFNPALGDPCGAVHGLAAVLAAIHRARRTGRGAWIDVSQVEALLSTMPLPLLRAQRSGAVEPPANGHSRFWPHGTYRCSGADSWVALAARVPRERAALLELVGADGLGRDAAERRLVDFIGSREADEVVDLVAALGVPVARVRTYEELLAEPEVPCDVVDHPWLGAQPLFGLGWRRAGQRLPVTRPAPLLGQHTREVLREVIGVGSRELTSD